MNPRTLLVVAALMSALAQGPVRADPAVRAAAAIPLDHLKATYLACDRAATRTILDAQTFERCALIGDELLRRGFDGDFDRLLVWWRVEKARSGQTGVASPR